MDRLQLYFQKCKPTNRIERRLYDFLIDVNGVPRQLDGRLMVHHIKELEKSWKERYNIDNLITLEHHTHEYVHQLYENGEREVVQELLQKAVNESLP